MIKNKLIISLVIAGTFSLVGCANNENDGLYQEVSSINTKDYQIDKLPYNYNALEPYIDSETVKLHYSKHTQAYADKLNALLKDFPDLKDKYSTVNDLLKNINKLPSEIQAGVIKFAGGVSNHNLYWKVLTPKGESKPTGKLADAINEKFGSFDKLKEQLSTSANNVFGSGWGWLVVNDKNELEIITTPNQDSPIMLGYRPLIPIDVWEHSYYLKYQNKRSEYVDNIWNLINWTIVSELYEDAIK